jgi:hypothetical protein
VAGGGKEGGEAAPPPLSPKGEKADRLGLARAERGSDPGIARCPEPGRFAVVGRFPRGLASG